jgi:polar amino acid transport system substrate-binding protein
MLNITPRIVRLITSFLFILFVNFSHAESTETVLRETILTETWPPYILSKDEPKGSAAKWLDLLFEHQNIKAEWQYMPYDVSFYYVNKGQRNVGFPFFKTSERAAKVLFSDPVFYVTSKMYYNRQYLNAESAKIAFEKKQKMGKVAGYSYGENLDKSLETAIEFGTEKQALTALFNHEIYLLPMTEGVMEHHLTNDFPLRKELIKPLKGIEDTSSLHVIAAKNKAGSKIVDNINQTIQVLANAGIDDLQTNKTNTPVAIDVAKLMTSEGYPLITGQTEKLGENIDYYALPQGTKVIVIQWSDKITQPSKSDRIYKNMMDLSKVVVLNGPHVGKELFVRNMHIELL